MREESAIITRIEDGKTWVKRLETNACSGCVQQSTCGTVFLSKWLPKRECLVDSSHIGQVGDEVRVVIDDTNLLLSSLLVYLFPLLLMLVGVILCDTLLPSNIAELWMPIIAVSLLLLAFRLIHFVQKQGLLLCWRFKPRIYARASDR